MAITSMPFGSVTLSDEDAAQFKAQVEGEPNDRVQGLYRRMHALEVNKKTGDVVIPRRQRAALVAVD